MKSQPSLAALLLLCSSCCSPTIPEFRSTIKKINPFKFVPSAPARSRKETSPLAATRRCGRAPGTAVVRLLRFAAPARTARLACHTHTTHCRSHLAARLLQRTRASQLRRDPSNRRGDFYRELPGIRASRWTNLW